MHLSSDAATSRRSRRLVALLATAVVAALAGATGADAAIVTSQDAQGRTITFDVRAATVDVEWYAEWLRRAAHGDEISNVTIRIVPEEDVDEYCGSGAAACYSNRRGGAGTMTLPAGNSQRVAQYLLHEYGHHLDGFWPIAGVRELNGTQAWWNLRGMAALFDRGDVAFDYSLGWNRSVAEIFAEDYAWIHLPIDYAIRWLSPPDDALRTALLQELSGSPPAVEPAPAPTAQPLVLTRSGTLGARATQAIPFGLLGPGRRVMLVATVARPTRAGARARAEIVCNGSRVAARTFTRGVSSRTIDVPNLGPANCSARLVSTTGVRLSYSLRLRLTIESR